MSISGNNAQHDALMKFDEEFDYMNSRLKIIRYKISSIHSADNECVNSLEGNIEAASNLDCVRRKNEESENVCADLYNATSEISYSNSCPTLLNKMSNMSIVSTNPVDVFSKLKEYQCNTNSEDKGTIKKHLVNTSMLMNKVKKTDRETDSYLKKLNNYVLPRCRSADITSDIVERNKSTDVPLKSTLKSQNVFKKQLDKKINKTKGKSVPQFKSQEKLLHFEKPGKNEREKETPQEIESIKESSMNNIDIVNISYENKVSNEEENNFHKCKHLTIQKIPRVDLKPDLVTQKLTNIRIKPVNKKTRSNSMSNAAYSELSFELESETCTCQPLIQTRMIKNKKVALDDIREILDEILENISSNDHSNNKLLNHLQTILQNLEKTCSFPNNYLNRLENLIKQYSMVDLNENIIKNIISEITENVFENENVGLDFDQMSVEIKRNSEQLLNRLTKIKNSILAINPSIKFPYDDSQQDQDVVNNSDKNHTICHSNNNFNSKKFQNNDFKSTNGFVSVREYLNHGSDNSAALKMFENVSVDKESGLHNTLYSKDRIIQNHNTLSHINTQNALNYYNISYQSEMLLKAATQDIERRGK